MESLLRHHTLKTHGRVGTLSQAVPTSLELDEDGHIQVTVGREGDIATDPLRYLEAVRRGLASLEETLGDAGRAARKQRLTWEEIGTALGVTRQSALEKYSVD